MEGYGLPSGLSRYFQMAPARLKPCPFKTRLRDCFSLENRPQRSGGVASLRVDAEVPDRWVDVRGGEDFNQRVLADGEVLGWCDLEPVLAGKDFDLGGDNIFVLG